MELQTEIRATVRNATPRVARGTVREGRYIPPDSPLYQAIVADLRAGTSYYRAARNAGVATNTARRIAMLEGLERHEPKTIAASQARAVFSHAARVALLDQALARLELLLQEVDSAKELEHIANAFAVLVDRRRLADHEVPFRE
jgi:hypothetical protein